MQNEKDNQKNGLSWPKPVPVQPALTATKPTPPSTPKISKGTSQTGLYAGFFAAGLIVGVLVSWGWSAAHAPQGSMANIATSTEASDNSATLSTQGTSVGSSDQMQMNSSLLVDSPQKAGDSVAIASASVDQPTWVVVYEETNGKPGNALGALLLDSSAENAAVELLRDTTPGQQYLVGESLDNGSHVFSLKDSQVSENGQTLWVAFTAN
jgi:hypothetical protein